VRAAADVAALASYDVAAKKLAVLAWHYHDDDVRGPDAAIELALAGLPAAATAPKLTHYRVDATHSNAYTLWKSLGSPVAPTKPQYQQLEAAAQLDKLADAPANITTSAGAASLQFTLPRQGVSLVVLEW
jgi:xylan 1,4-beta-xylosidase